MLKMRRETVCFMDDAHNRVREQFGAVAQNYVTSTIHGSGYTLDKLIELVESTPGKKALDIATGGGHMALGMARNGADVIASDLLMPMLRAAREFIAGNEVRAGFVNADAQRLPFADSAF